MATLHHGTVAYLVARSGFYKRLPGCFSQATAWLSQAGKLLPVCRRNRLPTCCPVAQKNRQIWENQAYAVRQRIWAQGSLLTGFYPYYIVFFAKMLG